MPWRVIVFGFQSEADAGDFLSSALLGWSQAGLSYIVLQDPEGDEEDT